LQNIYSQQGDRHIYVVYKIKRKGKGGEAYIHLFGKETISDIFNKVQRYYTHEKEPGRRDGKRGKQGERKGSERISCVRGEECGGGRGASEERRMSGEWRAGRTRPVRYAAPRERPGTLV
jgi:hypothetical protein